MRLVLTYHATRLNRLTRDGCDLLSLHADLNWFADQGISVLPVDDLLADPDVDGVAITLDDGTRIDGFPHLHPRLGLLPSMLQILRHAKRRLPRLCASNFVIASPFARDVLAAHLVDELGEALMDADWWSEAQASGLMQLENHSWDHNHPLLPNSVQRDNQRGNFLVIDSAQDAEAEIAVASDVIGHALGRRPRYFAYPFGDVSPYLRDVWLPTRGAAIGLHAAFSTEPRAIRRDDNPWSLPRFVCGRDWTDEHQLAVLVDSARRADQ
jgi:peptidoglycan/xylan/chitin deacetylase (PgdA/CDA1 family)